MEVRLKFPGLIVIGTMLLFSLTQGDYDVMVQFQERTQTIHAIQDFVRLKATRPEVARGALITELVGILQNIATKTQSKLIQFLNERGLPFDRLWLENEVCVFQVNQTIMDQINSIPNVVRARFAVRIIPPKAVYEDPPPLPEMYQHLTQTKARCKDIQCLGDGVGVAFIGTGIMYNHSELVGNYRTDYGWFDPGNRTQLPSSAGSNQGTHAAGLAVGKTKGVAPKASWIACLNMPNELGTELWAKKCGEFVLCPCKWSDETERNCNLAPDVVINTWTSVWYSFRSIYYITIMAWNAVDTLYVFPAGNGGATCMTIDIPAIYDISFAVGAVNGSSAFPSWSARGPVTNASWDVVSHSSSAQCKKGCTNSSTLCFFTKPDITAPGVNLNSSIATNTTAYDLQSGTEFAASVVGGVMTLMVCSNKGKLRLNQTVATAHLRKTASVERINQSEANKVYVPTRVSKLMCNKAYMEICDGDYADNLFGAGEVDACKAVKFTSSKTKRAGTGMSMSAIIHPTCQRDAD